MPHIGTVNIVPWHEACKQLGWDYIDPNGSCEHVFNAIGRARLLVTEALHGAITADALRTPWIATRSNGTILPFKWQDHCAAIDVPYQPIDIPVRWLVRGIMGTQRHPAKKALFGARAMLDTLWRSFDSMVEHMARAAKQPALLSDDAKIRWIDEQLHERVAWLRRELEADAGT